MQEDASPDTWKSKLREFDWFGHSVNLNFNREGDTHNTLIGGFCSVFFRIAMCVYIFLNVSKLILSSEDNILFSLSNDDSIETSTVSYASIDLAFYWILRTSMGFEG